MANPVAKAVPPLHPKRRPRLSKRRIIFITGTDTGVGKTVVTSLLLAHLRSRNVQALALKPFCSGSRGDARILNKIQAAELAIDEVNPWFFPEPLAPLTAGRRASGCPRLREVVSHVRAISSRCETLLIEGAGGLFVPLGEGYTVADVIKALRCEVVVVAANRLGCINHTLLTIAALRALRCARIQVVLSNQRKPGLSAASNEQIIAEFIRPVPVFSLPYLGRDFKRLKSSGHKPQPITPTAFIREVLLG